MAKVYKIGSIYRKRGAEMTELHDDILGCECSFIQLPVKGEQFALLFTIPVTKTGRRRDIITSGLVKYVEKEKFVTAETMNTVYILESVIA